MGTGPQKYPPASTAHWWQSKWGGDSMESNVIVWHSTEGTTLPDYDGGSMAPNLTAVPNWAAKRLDWFQHFDFDVSSRALVHQGVATNTLNVCQVEIVGTCDPATHARWAKAGVPHLYMPELPDWAVRDLSAFAAWAHTEQGVPLSSGLMFKAYPDSYGTSNGVRMSTSQWLAFKGHCGHQHVPSGNVHGDPGTFPMAAILAGAKPAPIPAPKPTYEPYPGASFFKAGRRSPIIAAMHKQLVAVGCNHYRSSTNTDVWGSGDVASYAAWQRHLGYTGVDANGIPGPTSWAKLHVPNV